MVKCNLCKDNIKETFLHKLKGTVIKIKGKHKYICQECQKKHPIQEIKDKL